MTAFGSLPPTGAGAPQVIIADTVKGKGVSRMELDVNWHVGNLGPEDYAAVRAELLGSAGQ